MRTLLALAAIALALAALSGCTSSPAADAGREPTPAAFQQPLFAGEPEQGAPAGPSGSHGQPQRDDGQVETGMTPTQVPGAYARQTVTITNDFGGASDGIVEIGASAGSITVLPGDGDGYTVEVKLEARGLTEQDARDALARAEVAHTDSLEADGLHLTTVVQEKPAAQPLPFIQFGNGAFLWADVTVTLPAAPAYDLSASASSGDLSASGLRGPSFRLSASSGALLLDHVNARDVALETSSGDIDLDTVQADHLEASASSGAITGSDLRLGVAKADTSSGDIALAGTVNTLEADASSGDLDLDLHGLQSGAYKLSASSGSITLKVLTGSGHAYKVHAEATSGEVSVDIGDTESNSTRDDRADAVSRGFDAAPIQTVVDVETSSGDITVES